MRATAPGRTIEVHSVAGFPATVRSGLLGAVRLLVVWAHRAHRTGVVVLADVAVRPDAVGADAGVVAHLGERVLETGVWPRLAYRSRPQSTPRSGVVTSCAAPSEPRSRSRQPR